MPKTSTQAPTKCPTCSHPTSHPGQRTCWYCSPNLLECPTCHENTLTPFEKTRGYQCRNCTAAAEFGVY